jgi:alpha-glucosidase
MSDGWWRRAVVYQVYIRSFADADGDGVGDIAGIRSRLPYLRDLGVDALWITPWYPSPMADGGYDVADYRAIDPVFGSLADAVALIDDAHGHGLRVVLDLVPNHTSSAHAWFVRALADGPGSPARARYVFRDGLGPDGAEPPNAWRSLFGGPAWRRVTEADGQPGQWYLHQFATEQPDLDWDNPEVRAMFEDVLRTWFARGVDGFRIDVANSLVKDLSAIDRPGEGAVSLDASAPGTMTPLSDQEGVHDVYRAWRAIADAQDPPRILLGEVHAPTPSRLARYVRPDELHGAFNFAFLRCPWDPARLRAVIDETLVAHGAVGAAPTWVLSNHDEIRHVTRYGRALTGIADRAHDERLPTDVALGTRRARAAILLMLALPGGVYLYQGEELGLPEVEDLPEAALRDPMHVRSGGAVRGRDGCRVPLPWSGEAPPFGFGPPGSSPWLPQPAAWAGLSVEAEAGDAGSMLALYRAGLRLRAALPGLTGESFRWLPAPDGVLLFERDAGLRCALNLSRATIAVPDGSTVLLRSDVTAGGRGTDRASLPTDTAAWLTVPGLVVDVSAGNSDNSTRD